MNLDTLFSTANSLAALGWAVLILAPRRPWVYRLLLGGVIGLMCIVYGVLMAMYFFRVEGGGFESLEQVQVLFSSREVALAGWIHYLAFDLAVGLWMARRFDAMGVSRWLQAPVLLVTFQFGPVGLLMALVLELFWRWQPKALSLPAESRP